MEKRTTKLFLFCCMAFICTLQFFAQGEKRTIEWSEYPYPISDEYKERVKFGHIIVPETRNSTNPRTLKIAFCILKGTSDNGLESPILRLPGGPGQEMISIAKYLFPSPNYIERFKFADVILFDPRGCGKSEPDLCPEMDTPEYDLQFLLGKTNKEMEQETIRVLKKCLDSLTLEKVDLNAYGSDEIAEDIEDLRITLGIGKWNVMGGSYGTRYGQGLIRKFPETVRSAYFSGLVPTVQNYVDRDLLSLKTIESIFESCNDDEQCSEAFPNLEESLFDALEYYSQNPIVIPVNEQKLFKNKKVVITGNVLVYGIFGLCFSKDGIEMLPQFIKTIADRKNWAIRSFVNEKGNMFGGLEKDMEFFINSNDNPVHGLDPNSDEYSSFVKRLAPYFIDLEIKSGLELAKIVGIELDSTQEIPIPSKTPVLLGTGEFDLVTPPENTYLVAKYLTNSTVFTFPGNGHWVRSPQCFSDILTTFFRDLKMPKDADSCIAKTEPHKFVTNVVYNKGVSKIGYKILAGKQNQVYIPFGIAILFIVFNFLGIPISSLIRYFKRKKNKSERKQVNWLPWILSFLVLVFVTLFYFAIKDAIDTNSFLLGFGILSSWNWIFWLVYFILILLVYSFIKRRINESKFEKVFVLSNWFGTILFMCLLFYWNLMLPFSS